MQTNEKLSKIRKEPNDEYYTQLKDIVKELKYYSFNEKIIYCPCDTINSNFVRYFMFNFNNFNLKGLFKRIVIKKKLINNLIKK